MASEDWYINELGKDVDKVCSTIKEASGTCFTVSFRLIWLQVTEIKSDYLEKREFMEKKLKNHQNIQELLKKQKYTRKRHEGSFRILTFEPTDFLRSSWIRLSSMDPSLLGSVLCTPSSWKWVAHGPILVSCLVLWQLWQDPRTILILGAPPIEVILLIFGLLRSRYQDSTRHARNYCEE